MIWEAVIFMDKVRQYMAATVFYDAEGGNFSYVSGGLRSHVAGPRLW